MKLSDMLFANVMMGEGGGGGGGGGSDFSTAAVTITNNANYQFNLALPIVDGDYLYGVTDSSWATGEKQVVLYKNYCEGFVITNSSSKIAVTGTGGVTTDGTFVMVTGDGTLTITDK